MSLPGAYGRHDTAGRTAGNRITCTLHQFVEEAFLGSRESATVVCCRITRRLSEIAGIGVVGKQVGCLRHRIVSDPEIA